MSIDLPRRLAATARLPACRALLIQLLLLLPVLVMATVLEARLALAVPLLATAAMQGMLAAAFSKWWGLAPWWSLIQFGFPVALVGFAGLAIPPFVFLLLFIALLALYWTTFRTQVPFFPSNAATHAEVARLLPADRPIRFIDIGSGLGGLVLDLARRRPDSHFTGIEVAPLPWLISRLRARNRSDNARFVFGNYEAIDLADYDVVFAFLSPAAMPALWEQARGRMRAGSLLLSYEFAVPGVTPDLTTAPDGRGACLFGWHM
jgi:SAM-dependent methyltransferase